MILSALPHTERRASGADVSGPFSFAGSILFVRGCRLILRPAQSRPKLGAGRPHDAIIASSLGQNSPIHRRGVARVDAVSEEAYVPATVSSAGFLGRVLNWGFRGGA